MIAKENRDYLRFLGQYFVALICRIESADPAKPTQDSRASGFVVSVRGVWFLVTAGHTFAEIENYKRDGYKVINWQIDDDFALVEKRIASVDGPGIPSTIPFDLDSQLKDYVYEENKIDYAFVHIPSFYIQQLRANGVKPFEEEHWELDANLVAADRVELLGIPYDQIKELNTSGLISRTLVAISVHRGEHEDEEMVVKSPHLLQAYIINPSLSGLPNFKSIQGMSGGPIIGFWKQPDGSEIMRVLAIQSAWIRSTSAKRTIMAFPVSEVVQHLQRLF